MFQLRAVPELNRVPTEQLAVLACGLHRRQVLIGALTKSGMQVEPAGQSDSYLVIDAEQRRAMLRFARDGAISVTTADGRTVTRWFDPEGRLRRMVDPAGVDMRIDHNGGEMRLDRGPYGSHVIRQYLFGLMTGVEFPAGTTSSIDWDALGGEIITDRAGHRSQRVRNEQGEQIGAIDPRGQHHAFNASEAEGFVERVSPSGRT